LSDQSLSALPISSDLSYLIFNRNKGILSIDQTGAELLKMAMSKLGLSARAYGRILKVSRTIADLSQSTDIHSEHLSEAMQYRSLDRNFYAM
jgi:magnesium chelatase family protein